MNGPNGIYPSFRSSEIVSSTFACAMALYILSINFYAFNSNGNKGIACGLNNLQKIRDGEPLGGKSRAEDDFSSDSEDEQDARPVAPKAAHGRAATEGNLDDFLA